MLNKRINPNLAEISELLELQGIGPKLAERILEKRPYHSIDDLQRVQGIGPANLEGWRDFLEVEGITTEAVTPMQDNDTEVDEETPVENLELEDEKAISEVEIDPVPAEVTSLTTPEQSIILVDEKEGNDKSSHKTTGRKPKENFTRDQVLLIVAGGSLLAFILAVGLVLGLLSGLNQGELRYASPSELNELFLSVESIDSRLTTQENDLQALRLRVDTLESLDDRMSAAEDSILTLTEELNTISADVNGLQEEVTGLGEEVAALETQTSLITAVFENLRDVFNQFFPEQGGEDE